MDPDLALRPALTYRCREAEERRHRQGAVLRQRRPWSRGVAENIRTYAGINQWFIFSAQTDR